MQKRRALGLCFNCNEKFTVGHKCQVSQILLLDRNSSTEEILCGEVNEELPRVEGKEEMQTEPKISLHTLAEWSVAMTMRVKEMIYSQEVIAEPLPHNMKRLLEDYASLFEEPTKLPPI